MYEIINHLCEYIGSQKQLETKRKLHKTFSLQIGQGGGAEKGSVVWVDEICHLIRALLFNTHIQGARTV